MFGAIAGGIASALAGGAMSKLFGGGQKAASGGIQGDVLATDNNTVGMGDAGIKSAIQGSNVPNPDEAVPSFVSGAIDRKSGSAGMPRPISYAVFCLKKKKRNKLLKRIGSYTTANTRWQRGGRSFTVLLQE